MGQDSHVVLELDDIQSGILRPRPAPYAACYFALRIDDRRSGREVMRRAPNVVASAAHPSSPAGDAWISVSLTFHGLRALGVPQASLDTFAPEFQQGMAARAHELLDNGESSPEHWEKPLGTSDVHIIVTALAPDQGRLDEIAERGRKALAELPGIASVWRQDCHALPNEKEPFGFRDGVSHPAIEGSGIAGTNPAERPLKAGEFILGYPDELGGLPPIPEPPELGRNGTYAVFRKLHQRVAAFRQYLCANAGTAEEQELLAAKMMGRWRSGAPLALSPQTDNPALGADPRRNNDFQFADDAVGLKTPPGSHIRRTNPRDAAIAGAVRLHRMIRRGTAYGSPLPEGVLEDDGTDRGIIFAFIGSHLKRQFEFVQSEWTDSCDFFGATTDRDPISGANDATGGFTAPK